MKAKNDQSGAITIESLTWIFLTLIALLIASSIFVPSVRDAMIEMMRGTMSEHYYVYELPCPDGTIPAEVVSFNGVDVSGNGKYTVHIGSLGNVKALRPAQHQSADTYSVTIASTSGIYICVRDDDRNGIPDPTW